LAVSTLRLRTVSPVASSSRLARSAHLGSHRGQHLIGGLELLACVNAAFLAPQPLVAEQVRAGQFRADADTAVRHLPAADPGDWPGGSWTIQRPNATWVVDRSPAAQPAALVQLSSGSLWRVATGTSQWMRRESVPASQVIRSPDRQP